MAIKNNRSDILHRIRCKLYPSYLPSTNGTYLARTSNEKSLSVEQVCASLKDRAGYTGNYDDLLNAVKQFNEEAMYLLCDGFAINNGYYSVYPSVRGTFESAKEEYRREKNPIEFRFRVNAALRKLARYIAVELEGLADAAGYIDKFFDVDENSENGLFSPNSQFKISGYKIKVAGDDPAVGVFFVPVDDPAKAVKVSRLAENSPTKIIGIAPKTKSKVNRIEVRTQYAGYSGAFLKKIRVIASDFTIEAA